MSVAKPEAPPDLSQTKDYSEVEEKKVIHVIPNAASNDYASNDAQTLREASTSMMNAENSA